MATAFPVELHRFEFNFDQEWADTILELEALEPEGEKTDISKSELFDLIAKDGYTHRTFVGMTIAQAREVQAIIAAEIAKYDAWEAKSNG